jgi:hypothetical protein
MYITTMTNTMNNTATANGKPLYFQIGDKVRHCLDIEKGWNDYGVGEVTAILYDKSGGFNYYAVYFPTARGQWITQYNYWDLQKVEA